MYALLVVEGGLDPDYVLNKMTMMEIEPLVNAIEHKSRPSWERARMVAILLGNCLGAKLKQKDIPFPWDNEADEPAKTTTGDELRTARRKLELLRKRQTK